MSPAQPDAAFGTEPRFLHTEQAAEIVASIRHELANPVNSVKSALTVLRSGLGTFSRDKQLDYLDRTLAEIQRIEYLLRILGGFDVKADFRLEHLDLCAFLDAFESGPNVRRGALVHTPGSGGVRVWADARALRQVLVNVLKNAEDAIASRPGALIRIELSASSDNATLKIIDGGTGMHTDDLRHLFEPFWTTKPNGTGLGLVICNRLMTSMGGSIALSSVEGQGTTVTLRLSRVEED